MLFRSDRQWAGNNLCNLGLLLQQRGLLDQAREAMDEALIHARELGHVRLECITSTNLALLAVARRDDAAAAALFDQALRLARELGDRRTEGQVLGYLGALHAREGRADEAWHLYDSGEALLDEAADPLSLALLLCDRVESERRAGLAGTAARTLSRAAAMGRAIGIDAASELGQRLDGLASVSPSPAGADPALNRPG